jgi:nitrogen regulatory protein PII
MKKIEAIFQRFKLDEIVEALRNEKIRRFSFSGTEGGGRDQLDLRQYRGVSVSDNSSEVSIGVIVDDDEAVRVAQMLVTTLRSGKMSDGEVAIMPLENVIRVRVGKCA